MPGDERVELFERSLEPLCRPCRPHVAEHPQEVDTRTGAGRDLPVRPDEVPGRKPFLGGERSEQHVRRVVIERKQGEPAVAVGGCDGTRREATEASASVVKQHRAAKLHRPIVPAARA